ncbi:hypothetical protein KBW98_03950 [Massilia sp. ST3]|nr:hypothetical protein [Massilia sp. ST3]MBQ5946635.1 hypothetical protein [Massilia sp. ST3]
MLWLLAARKKKHRQPRQPPKLRSPLRLTPLLLRPLRLLTLLSLRLLTLPLLLRKLLRLLLTRLLPLRLLLRPLLKLPSSNQNFSDSKNRPAGRFFFACTFCVVRHGLVERVDGQAVHPTASAAMTLP